VIGIGDFPSNQYDNGHEKQAPCIKALYKQHRSEHHKMTPIKNPAIDATTIFHNKGLKGAPYEDAYQICHIKEGG